MAKIVYLRTDKNGTKYYANYTCPRCGGAGGSDKWAFTGWTCYECGGTGESPTPVIEKEYTPEYRAKLDERARKRAEAKRAKQVEEFNSNRLVIAEKYGFNPEGKIYVVVGNTYEIREELKEAWSRVRDEGVGVMGDFIGKPFTATTMSELNYLVNAPLESINRELREELGIELYVNTLPQIEDNSVSGFLMVKRVGEPVRFI